MTGAGRHPRIGVDLDNTIVCYDALFHRLACERGVVPASLAATKLAVRGHLRATGREEIWTELQGEAYGPRMGEAVAFSKCLDVLQHCIAAGMDVVIVSHRTRTPHAGEQYDLHGAARAWLEDAGIVADRGPALRREDVYLETTRAAKCARVAALGCTHFIDDLPDVFAEATFPRDVVRVLFDPDGAHGGKHAEARVRSWVAVAALLAEVREAS